MSTKNAINNRSGDLTIDPGASGDSFVQFDINGTGEFRIGVDDDASNAFKISQGSALGTTDTFVVTADGEITMPLQPAFFSVNTSGASDVTGDGTNYTVLFDSEIYDQNNDFASSTFTAPVEGKYFFSWAVEITDIASGHAGNYRLVASNRTLKAPTAVNWGAFKDSTDSAQSSASAYMDMDAADVVRIDINIAGGSKVIDVVGSATSDPVTYFSGSLVT